MAGLTTEKIELDGVTGTLMTFRASAAGEPGDWGRKVKPALREHGKPAPVEVRLRAGGRLLGEATLNAQSFVTIVGGFDLLDGTSLYKDGAHVSSVTEVKLFLPDPQLDWVEDGIALAANMLGWRVAYRDADGDWSMGGGSDWYPSAEELRDAFPAYTFSRHPAVLKAIEAATA